MRFRDELRNAVHARDVKALQSLVSPDIAVGESQEYKAGFEAFVNHFFGRDPEVASMNWSEIEYILARGGVMEPGGTFCVPYFSCVGHWEPDEVFVLGTDIPAYARPDVTSPVVEQLSCDLLRVVQSGDQGVAALPMKWWGVRLNTGAIAFVEERFIGVPGFILRIGLRDGKWTVIQLYGTD